jgi:NADP-dependent 3-hydroxy acid dehydrogenase YdfG
VATDFFTNALHSDNTSAQNITELFTTMKPIEPVDVADAVIYILSTPAHVQVRFFSPKVRGVLNQALLNNFNL